MRVLILARDSERRAAIARRAAAGGLDVVGSHSAPSEGLDLREADAIVVDVRDLDVDASLDAALAPYVVVMFVDGPASHASASRLRARGVVIVPGDRPDVDLPALAGAAAEGFIVAASEWRADEDSADEFTKMRVGPREPPVEIDAMVEVLTSREQDVFELLATGLSNRRIAETLGISEHTAKYHVASIFGKLGVTTRAAAVSRGLRRGLVTT